MRLTRCLSAGKARLQLGESLLSDDISLTELLALRRADIMFQLVNSGKNEGRIDAILSTPEESQEVWASGVTYLRSRVEREAESTAADVYAKVYEAERQELFFKAQGWRVVPHGGKIRIRKDSTWNVPEPELTLVVNRFSEIVGYTAGNDVSSRSIEGENPLYLPQAKSYDGSCAIGPSIVIATEEEMADLTISCSIMRSGKEVFKGKTGVAQMKRRLSELVGFLFREMSFPNGAFLMTGTGIIPKANFTLSSGDVVTVQVGEVILTNEVA